MSASLQTKKRATEVARFSEDSQENKNLFVFDIGDFVADFQYCRGHPKVHQYSKLYGTLITLSMQTNGSFFLKIHFLKMWQFWKT